MNWCIFQPPQVTLTIQQQMPQSPTANELEYQAITLTHILVRFEDEWLPEHTQLVRTCLFVCMCVNIEKCRKYKGIQFMQIEYLGTQILCFMLLPKTTSDESVKFKDGRYPEEKQYSKSCQFYHIKTTVFPLFSAHAPISALQGHFCIRCAKAHPYFRCETSDTQKKQNLPYF